MRHHRSVLRAWFVLVVASWLPGCSLERSSVEGEHRFDAGSDPPIVRDAGEPRDDAALDAFVPPDAPAIDAYVPPVPELCPPDPALVACYHFDADTNDHGARGNHLQAAAITFEASGGVLLSASSSLVRAPQADLTHTLTTVDAWVRLDAAPPAGTRAMIADHDGVFGLWILDGTLVCAMTTTVSGASSAMASGVVMQGALHHVACVFDGMKTSLFVDAIRVASVDATGESVTPSTPLQIGENATAGNDQWIGVIDDLRLWDRALTVDELAAHVARGR